MLAHGPAKHCGIIALKQVRSDSVAGRGSASNDVAEKDGALTLIHSRQNKRVSEEIFSSAWRHKLVYAFRL